MIVDTSVILAILFEENETNEFLFAIGAADIARFSVASYIEAITRVERLKSPLAIQKFEEIIDRLPLVFEAVTIEHARVARDGFRAFGKSLHPAGLNFGDCFVYALAKISGEPLLFKGDDFTKTDIPSALPMKPSA